MEECFMGAGDAHTFSYNISQGRFPDKSSISYQGIFSEHSYTLSKPATSSSSTRQLHIETRCAESGEIYISQLISSIYDGQPRDSRPIDISVVIDQSGSMGSTMENFTQLELAKKAPSDLFSILRENDRIAVSRFNDKGHVVWPMKEVSKCHKQKLLEAVEGINIDGGTTLEAGFSCGLGVFREWEKTNSYQEDHMSRQRRILFLTDMDDMSSNQLQEMLKSSSEEGIYTTIIGIGISFNSQLTESIIKVPGANYFSVRDPQDLKEIIVDHFYFNFFPVASNTRMVCTSSEFQLEESFGVPLDPELETLDLSWLPKHHRKFPSEFRQRALTLLLCQKQLRRKLPLLAFSHIMDFIAPREVEITRLETIFPSATPAIDQIKGGLILTKFRPKDPSISKGSIEISLQWTSLEGKDDSISHCIPIDATFQKSIANSNTPTVDKGYLLMKFVSFCHEIIDGGEGNKSNHAKVDEFEQWFRSQAQQFPDDSRFENRLDDLKNLKKILETQKVKKLHD